MFWAFLANKALSVKVSYIKKPEAISANSAKIGIKLSRWTNTQVCVSSLYDEELVIVKVEILFSKFFCRVLSLSIELNDSQKVYYLWWRRRRLSVTRGLDYLLNIWLFTSVKINPIALKNCLSRLKICQLLQNWLRLWKYCQSGEISPNLVTLRGFCDVEYLTKTKADFLLMIR